MSSDMYVLTVSVPAIANEWWIHSISHLDVLSYKWKADASRRSSLSSFSVPSFSVPPLARSSRFRERKDGFAVPRAWVPHVRNPTRDFGQDAPFLSLLRQIHNVAFYNILDMTLLFNKSTDSHSDPIVYSPFAYRTNHAPGNHAGNFFTMCKAHQRLHPVDRGLRLTNWKEINDVRALRADPSSQLIDFVSNAKKWVVFWSYMVAIRNLHDNRSGEALDDKFNSMRAHENWRHTAVDVLPICRGFAINSGRESMPVGFGSPDRQEMFVVTAGFERFFSSLEILLCIEGIQVTVKPNRVYSPKFWSVQIVLTHRLGSTYSSIMGKRGLSLYITLRFPRRSLATSSLFRTIMDFWSTLNPMISPVCWD